MMRIFLWLLLTLLLPSLLMAGEITVFAGSASQPPLEEAARTFQQQTGIRVILHLGGSGAMLNQVRLSRTADLYIPGSPDFMEKAKRLQLVDSQSEQILAYLIPAINVAKGNPKQIYRLRDLARPELKIGIADPDAVCVGLYGVEILEHAGLAEATRKNMTARVESCSKTAALIVLRAADATLGWREFASWNPEKIESILLPPEQIVRLAYIPAAVVKTAPNPEEAQRFLEFLQSVQGREIFTRWGYLTDESAARRFAPQARIGGEYLLPGGW